MIRICEADEKESRQILEFTKIVGRESDNLSYGEEGIEIPVEAEERYLKTVRESETSAFFLAKDEDRIVGMANFDVPTSRKRLKHSATIGISVRRSYWGKGVGSLLMKKMIEHGKQIKTKVIYLEVRSDNDRAIALYKKYGFVKTGVRHGLMRIEGRPVDVDMMELIMEE